jgi:hypothetical protein
MPDQQIQLCLKASDRDHLRAVCQPLGRETGRRPFQHAAHLNRVGYRPS